MKEEDKEARELIVERFMSISLCCKQLDIKVQTFFNNQNYTMLWKQAKEINPKIKRIKPDFPKTFKEALSNKGLTMTDFADSIGLKLYAVVNSIERCKRWPNKRLAFILSEAESIHGIILTTDKIHEQHEGTDYEQHTEIAEASPVNTEADRLNEFLPKQQDWSIVPKDEAARDRNKPVH